MSISQKKSEFSGQTAVIDNDSFDFVREGQNFKVLFSDFKLSLGITGTLQSIGSPLGNPVMTQAGTVFSFRAIESGSGILAQLSPLNGIEIGLNLTQDSEGEPIFDDVGAVKPTVASIKSVGGCTIIKVGNVITISVP